MDELEYGIVYVTAGQFKGQIVYYDDIDRRTAICYTGHPLDFVHCYNIPVRFLRVPVIKELLNRREAIWRILTDEAVKGEWRLEPDEVHSLWSEKALITDLLFERRMLGEIEHFSGEKMIFLCHSSSDKGFVRMVNDDLRRLGAQTWLDENNIKVGQSIVDKISSGLKDSRYLMIFLSPKSIQSLWATREWQSFLSRQLSGNTITVLPVLIEKCDIPAILADLKYANFTESYYDGLKELRAALV